MADTTLKIVSFLYILVISLAALHIVNQFSSFLETFKSNLESIKSMNEKNSRRYEEDVAKLKKMIEEYDKIKGNKKIHSNNQHRLESIKSKNEKSGFDMRSNEEDNAKLKKIYECGKR
ncbi:hypothetical protein P8452_16940 [Trifolium repens]|nr:hypothetical protein P8452_16940 [Trifolium repens]